MNPKQKRPLGVTLLALAFLWIGCFGTLFFPLIGLTGGTFTLWKLAFGAMIHSELWLKIIAHSLDCILFGLYVAYAVIGFGLWKLKNWARKSALTITTLGVVLGLVVALVYVRPLLMGFSVFGCATFYFGWIAWYLMRPRVRFAFDAWSLYDSAGVRREPPQLSKSGRFGVGILCVASCLVLFVVPLYFAIDKEMRGSDAYKLAMHTAQSSPCVLNTLGAPLETRGFMTGEMEESSVEGSAQLSIPIKGPKGKGRLELQAKKLNGSWEIESLIFAHATMQVILAPSESNRACQ